MRVVGECKLHSMRGQCLLVSPGLEGAFEGNLGLSSSFTLFTVRLPSPGLGFHETTDSWQAL